MVRVVLADGGAGADPPMAVILPVEARTVAEQVRQIVREELARVGLTPPNPHLAPGVYRLDAEGAWHREAAPPPETAGAPPATGGA